MAITDLTNTTWYFIGVPYLLSGGFDPFEAEFVCNGQTYRSIMVDGDEGYSSTDGLWFCTERIFDKDKAIKVYDYETGKWINEAYRTINIVSVPYENFVSTFIYYSDIVQLKVTDLTNTTWTVASGWQTSAGYGNFSINGSYVYRVGNLPAMDYFDNFRIGITARDINESNVIGFVGRDFVPSETVQVTFEDGTDTTNPKLIAWLSKYGELQEEKITDLTGYTVTVPSGWTASGGYGKFTVSGFYGNANAILEYINIGYSDYDYSEANWIDVNSVFYGNNVSLLFTFMGGADVTNTLLIQWLYDNNATFTKTEEPETLTLTYDLSQLDLPEGIYSITVVAKADGYSNSASSNVVEYVVEASLPVWNETDLTGTTWEISNYQANPRGLYNITGTAVGKFKPTNGLSQGKYSPSFYMFFVGVDADTGEPAIGFVAEHQYYGEVNYNSIRNESYLVTFTGGTDTKNTALKSWLIENGTLTSHRMLTDLTNITWNIPSGWSVEAGFRAPFDIEGTINNTSIVSGLFMGYEEDYEFMSNEKSNCISVNYDNPVVIYNTSSIYLHITGGTDTTDTDLIKWLYSYGYKAQEEHIGGSN